MGAALQPVPEDAPECSGAPTSAAAVGSSAQAAPVLEVVRDLSALVTHHPCTETDSSIGGQTTCIVCFTNPKTHLAAPCGHQCVCEECSRELEACPICRSVAVLWVKLLVV